MTTTTADAGRYGEAIPVTLDRMSDRYNVYSTTMTWGDLDSLAFDAAQAVRLGWVIKDGNRWIAYATAYAAGRTDDRHVACRGRTFLVSEVR